MINPNKKGREYEKEVARWLTIFTGVKYKPTPRSGALHQVFDFDVMKVDRREESVLDGIGIEIKNEKLSVAAPVLDVFDRPEFYHPVILFNNAPKTSDRSDIQEKYAVMERELFEKFILQMRRQKAGDSYHVPQHDLFQERPSGAFARWIAQCKDAAIDANVTHWIIVFRGKGKNYVLIENKFFERMKEELCHMKKLTS